jgi:hypothetical protein
MMSCGRRNCQMSSPGVGGPASNRILVEKGALTRSGERRHTRYALNLLAINGME